MHRRLGAASSPSRERLTEEVCATTGYARLVVDQALGELFRGLSAPMGWLEDAPGLLTPSLRTVAIYAAGNIPGHALPAAAVALAMGHRVVLKPSRREPVTARFWVDTIQCLEPRITNRIKVLSPDTAVGPADAVIAFGSDAALEAIRASHPRVPFLRFGHRFSLAWLAAPPTPEMVAGLARDVVEFDQQGCLSPQVALVSEGAEPEQWTRQLADELERLRACIPRRPLELAEHTSIQRFRAHHQLQALRDSDARLFASSGATAWTVALSRRLPVEYPLNRTIALCRVGSIQAGIRLLTPFHGQLGTVTTDVPREQAEWRHWGRVARRVCCLGAAQHPADPTRHEGQSVVEWLRRLTDPSAP